MVAAAALGDVVEQRGDVEQPVALEGHDQPRHQRVFVRVLSHREPAHVAQHHQDVLVDRIDVEEVVLHLADDAPPRRDVARQDAVLVHLAEHPHDTAALLQDLQEEDTVRGVGAKRGIDLIAVDPQRAQGARRHALELGALLQQQEAFEQRGRVALEDVLVADVEQLAHDLEARVDHDRGAAVGEDHAAVVLQQHGVELHHHLGGDVVALHQHLGGAPGGRGLDAEDAGELFLVVEEQAVLRAPGEMMQADADVLQEALDRAQFAGFAAGDEAVAGEVAPAVAKPGRACDPAQHLQVAQPAGALLAVGLEGVGRVVEAGVALFLLEQLGLVEGAHVERFAVARAQLGKQRRVAGEQTRLEQVGLHGDVVGGGDHAFVDRAHRMTDLEPAVPQRADQRRQARRSAPRRRCG